MHRSGEPPLAIFESTTVDTSTMSWYRKVPGGVHDNGLTRQGECGRWLAKHYSGKNVSYATARWRFYQRLLNPPSDSSQGT